MSEDLSIHEELTAAFAEHEETPEPSVTPEVTSTSDRDENGRFKAKEEEPVVAAVEVAPEATATPEVTPPAEEPQVLGTEQVALSVDKAPSSWTPAAREKWAAIDPDIQAEIIRREEASANGVRHMQDQMEPQRQFITAMGPVAQEAQSIGQDPVPYIHGLAMSERTLRTADVPAKFQELLRIADQYGIPLREVINESVGEQVIQAAPQQQQQMHPQMQQELNEMRQWRQTQGQQQAVSQVEQFGSDKEFFNDVRQEMAGLIESGMATDMSSAYESACWSNPGVRTVMLARKSTSATAETVATRQKAAAGASVKPSGAIHVPSPDDESDDISDVVRKAWNASASGRV